MVDKILAENPDIDLIKISVHGQYHGRALAFNISLPSVGEKVVVIGNPLGLEQSVSDGIVSAIREEAWNITYIQLTAPISPGSSGSPVLNTNGEVIGVATFQSVEGQNLNFAVPSILIFMGMRRWDGGISISKWSAKQEPLITNKQEIEENNFIPSNNPPPKPQIPPPPTPPEEYKEYFTQYYSNRSAYEDSVFETLGGNPFAINPDQEVDKATQDLRPLFEHVFQGKVFWRNRHELDPERRKWWNDVVKSYRSRVLNAAKSERVTKIDTYNQMMTRFDLAWEEYQAALQRYEYNYLK